VSRLDQVRPNRLDGFVNRDALDSRRVWYATNRFFGVSLLVGGLLTAGGTGVVLAEKANLATKAIAGIEFIIVVAVFLAALAATFARLRRM